MDARFSSRFAGIRPQQIIYIQLMKKSELQKVLFRSLFDSPEIIRIVFSYSMS